MKLMKAENVSFCNEIVTAEDWCRGETGELTMFGKHNKLISEIKQGFNLYPHHCGMSIVLDLNDQRWVIEVSVSVPVCLSVCVGLCVCLCVSL